MSKKVVVLVGAGVAAAGIGYYLWKKKQDAANQSAALTQVTDSAGNVTSSPSVSTSSSAATPGIVAAPASGGTAANLTKQTMWKDAAGNTFQMTTDKGKWGYWIKVNGATQSKNNMQEIMTLGPDGFMYAADNNGTWQVYKNGGWQVLIKDDKAKTKIEAAKLGLNYLSGLAGFGFALQARGVQGLAGLGNAFLLNG